MDDCAEVVELEAVAELVGRVAAIDIAKSSAMVCTRLPAQTDPHRRVQKTLALDPGDWTPDTLGS